MIASRRFWIILITLTAGSIALVWWPAVPLGIPGEWTWSRIPADTAFGMISGTTIVTIIAAIYLLYVGIAATRLSRCGRFEVAAWLTGLTVIAFAWLWHVQENQPAGYGLSKAAWVLYYPETSGYFYEALYEIDDAGEFLSSYESRMEEGDYLHIGTHPPGLFLLHKALIEVCHRYPGLSRSLRDTQPESVQLAFQVLSLNTQRTGLPLRPADTSALWLAALLTQAAAIVAVVPLYHLLRFWHPRETAWKAIAFWPLIPALAIFLPKSDALFPLIAFSFLYLWAKCLRTRGVIVLNGSSDVRHRSALSVLRTINRWLRESHLVCAMLAGLTLWLGMLFSLALLPIALIAAVFSFIELRKPSADQNSVSFPKRCAMTYGAGAVTFLVLSILAGILFDINLLSVWVLNFQNHASFYEHFERTRLKWLLVNPLELSLATGVPLTGLAALSVLRLLRGTSSNAHSGNSFLCSGILVWGILWLSGKNMGEAARLWIVMMPILVVTASSVLSMPSNDAITEESDKSPIRNWLILLALQASVCVFTANRVDGFHLSRAADSQPVESSTGNTNP